MMGQSESKHKGAALILVLWLVASLSLVVAAGVQGVRQQTQRTSIDLERLRSETILDAAVQLVSQRLFAEKNNFGGYQVLRVPLGSNDVWVEITPSEGLIDVNVASDELLQALFQRVGGLSQGEALIMTARVRDFIDVDDIPNGVGGAESAQYRAAGWPAVPRNSALDDISELKFVLGMTAELYEIIAPHLGMNGQQRLEINSAPPALVDALTGQPGLGSRIHTSSPETRAGMLLSVSGSEFFSSLGSSGVRTVRVRAYVRSPDSRWWQRQVWVDLSERPDSLTPWTTLAVEPTRRLLSSQQESKK